MNKLQVKLLHFERALQRLSEAIRALQSDSDNDIIQDAVIQGFEKDLPI